LAPVGGGGAVKTHRGTEREGAGMVGRGRGASKVKRGYRNGIRADEKCTENEPDQKLDPSGRKGEKNFWMRANDIVAKSNRAKTLLVEKK